MAYEKDYTVHYMLGGKNINVWWNNNTPDKPSNVWFNKIQWIDRTKYFKINYIDITSASIVLNNAHTYSPKDGVEYIRFGSRVVGLTNIVYKYYFVSNVIMETALNTTYELELDVWATYILPVFMNTTASFQRLSYLKNIPNDLEIKQVISAGELPFDYYNLSKITTTFSQKVISIDGDTVGNSHRYLVSDRYQIEPWIKYNLKVISGSTIGKYGESKLEINGGGWDNIYFIRNGVREFSDKIIIYPVLATTQQVSVYINGKLSDCYNTIDLLMRHVNHPEIINTFGGLFIGPPLAQLLVALSETGENGRNVSGIYDVAFEKNRDAPTNILAIRTPFFVNFKMKLFEYTKTIPPSPSSLALPRYDIVTNTLMQGVESLKSCYAYSVFLNKQITIREMIAIDDTTAKLVNRVDLTGTIAKEGVCLFSANNDGFFGPLKETWLLQHNLPTITNEYNKYVSGVMSATNNGVRQINQQRDFGIRQSHFNELEQFVGNATSLKGNIVDSATGDASLSDVSKTILTMVNAPRHNQANRKKINMNADNQLLAMKAHFQDKARTLQPSVNSSPVDTMIQINSMYPQPYGNTNEFRFTKYIYDITKDGNNMLSYLMYHFYNGFMCDVTTSFKNVVSSTPESKYGNMYIFKLNITNLSEYVNINYGGTLYEKQLITDILSGIIRVWDETPSIEKIEKKALEFKDAK